MPAARLLIVACLSCQALALVAPSATLAAPANSPVGQVLVVSVNLYDTEEPDASNTQDMRNFADRVLKQAPYIPDVLLLQEVRHKSVEAVRKFVSNETGQRYEIAVDAGEVPFQEISSTKVVGTDTAIVINAETMRKDGGGYFKTDYSLSDAAPGSKVKSKKHAYGQVVERAAGGLAVPVVSLHYPKQREFKSESTSQALKKKWSKLIAKKLASKYPSNAIDHPKVIAGDFNNFRCSNNGQDGCNETPLYDLLTGSPFSYKDSVLTMEGGASNPIDFVFVRGNVVSAGRDIDYDPGTNNKDVFYSNHQFRWALLEAADTTGPTSPGQITNSNGYGSFTRIRGWEKVRDGGSGFEHYEVWRSVGDDQNFELLDSTVEQTYEDRAVDEGQTYFYFVVAVDNAGNASVPTNTESVKAGS